MIIIVEPQYKKVHYDLDLLNVEVAIFQPHVKKSNDTPA